MTNQIGQIKNKNGAVTCGVNLNKNGSFSFIKANKSCITATKEQLIAGWWMGEIPKKAREIAINHK